MSLALPSARRILVTGAGGFVGSHLVEHLLRLGCRVRAMVRYQSGGSRGWLDEIEGASRLEIVAGDVRDHDTTLAAAKDCDVVFHLAALIGIPYSYVTPLAYVRTNLEGTLNVLEAARALGVARLVVTSTSEVYGSAQRLPMDETHPVHSQSPYAATKAGADELALSFHRAFGLPVAVARPFNVYGPRQSDRAIIPTIATQLLAGGPPAWAKESNPAKSGQKRIRLMKHLLPVERADRNRPPPSFPSTIPRDCRSIAGAFSAAPKTSKRTPDQGQASVS